jgi:hypothetical protein
VKIAPLAGNNRSRGLAGVEFRDRHPMTGAVRLSVRDERFERFRQEVRRNSDARMGDVEDDLIIQQVGMKLT